MDVLATVSMDMNLIIWNLESNEMVGIFLFYGVCVGLINAQGLLVTLEL